MASIKKIVGGMIAVGASFVGLVAAGKSGFGKDLGTDFAPTLEPIGGDPSKNSMPEATAPAVEEINEGMEEAK